MFFWNSLGFSMSQQMLAIWSLVPLSFLNPAWTVESSRLLKPNLKDSEHYFSMWNECNCAVVWTSFGTALLWDWGKGKYNLSLLPLFSFYLPCSDGTRCHDLSFLNTVSSQLFHSSFTLIKRLFSSSLLSAIRVVSSAYLRLLIFLLAFCMMYSAYKLNKLNHKTLNTLDLLLSHFWTSPLFHVQFCCFLTHIQVSQETRKVV